MTVHWAFKQLGIDPTTETGAIRRAYAHLLKGMDVDADVDGYARLRNARDAALAYAAGAIDDVVEEPRLEDRLEPGEAQPGGAQPGLEASSEEAIEEAPPEAPQPPNEIALAQQRLTTLLFPGGEQMYLLTPEESDEALRCFEFLKTDPRLDQIDMLASASDWFAQIIAQSMPRSDPLIRPAATYFGWRRDQEVGVHPAVAAIISRANALDWRDGLQSRSHRLHRAWKELTRPAYEHSKRGWVSAKRIGQLLREVRTRYPSLEGDLDWYRVNLWEGAQSERRVQFSGGSIAILVFIAISVLGRLADGPSSTSPAQPSPVATFPSRPLSQPSVDIGEAIDGLTDVATLRSENPKLYSLLWTNWQLAKDNGQDANQFVRANRGSILERVERSWARASYSVLKHKMEVDVQIAHQMTADNCANYLGGPIPQLTQAQIDLHRRVEGERLLEIDPTQPIGAESYGTYRYSIPGPVIADAMKRYSLTRQQFGKGLDLAVPGGSSPGIACNARLGLREAILSQPKDIALPIMRDMED